MCQWYVHRFRLTYMLCQDMSLGNLQPNVNVIHLPMVSQDTNNAKLGDHIDELQ